MSFTEESHSGSPLQARVGKVPVWAIGVGLAGAFVLFMFWRNRKVKAVTSQPSAVGDMPAFTETTPSQVDGLPPGAIGDFLNADPTNPAFPVGQTPRGIPGPVTNTQWSRLAFDWLVGQGMDPTLVERAIQKYIMGQDLTGAETSVKNIALQVFGAPPEGLIASASTITPPPTSTEQPPVSTQPPTQGGSQGPQYITVSAGQDVYDTFAQLGEIPVVWARVTAFNGTFPVYWVDRPGNPDGNAPKFAQNMTLRVA